MSTKRNAHLSRIPRRGKLTPKPDPKHVVSSKVPSGSAEEKILALARTGVERFILKNATVEEFLGIMRAVSEQEKTYSHQLTRSALSRIVKEAIKKRKLGRPK